MHTNTTNGLCVRWVRSFASGQHHYFLYKMIKVLPSNISVHCMESTATKRWLFNIANENMRVIFSHYFVSIFSLSLILLQGFRGTKVMKLILLKVNLLSSCISTEIGKLSYEYKFICSFMEYCWSCHNLVSHNKLTQQYSIRVRKKSLP